VTNTPTPTPLVSPTPTQLPHDRYTAGVANAIQFIEANGGVDPGLKAVLDSILLLPSDQIPGALAELVPVFAGAGIYILPTIANQMSDVIDTASGMGGGSGGDQTPTDRFLWMKPFALQSDQDKKDGVPGYTADIQGLMLGGDDQINSSTRVGWDFGFAQTNADGKEELSGQSLDIDTYQLGLYARKEIEVDTYLTGKIQFGWNRNESSRDITLAGTAKADYDSWYSLLNATVGKQFEINKELTLTPELSINYIHIDEESYTEHGSPAALHVDGRNEDSLIFSIGSKLNFRIEDDSTLTAHLELGYETLNDHAQLSSTFVGGGPAFNVNGAEPGRLLLTTGFGVNLMETQQMNMSINYEATIRDQYTDQSLSTTIRYKW
jgi:outer membrane autotransporter protein